MGFKDELENAYSALEQLLVGYEKDLNEKNAMALEDALMAIDETLNEKGEE